MFSLSRKALLCALVFVAVLAPAAEAAFTLPLAKIVAPKKVQSPKPDPAPSASPLETVARQQAHFRKARRYIRRTYLRPPVARRSGRRAAYLIRHAPTRQIEKRLLKVRRHAKHAGLRRAEMHRLTPYVGPDGQRWAIPAPIVRCESGYRWHAYNPSGARGPYQFLGWPVPWPVRTEADKMAHHRMAAALWRGGAGASHWVCKG